MATRDTGGREKGLTGGPEPSVVVERKEGHGSGCPPELGRPKRETRGGEGKKANGPAGRCAGQLGGLGQRPKARKEGGEGEKNFFIF
jgi:hypothetical protein